MEIRPIQDTDRNALESFLQRVPEGDRTFFRADVSDPAVVDAMLCAAGTTSVAVEGDAVVGYVAVEPLQGWSSHVGEVRVIVDPDQRGRGIGRELARYAVLHALELGLTKMVVEVVADQAPAVAMFRSLGFDPEALLRGHVRDGAGDLRDLIILAHSVEESYAAMTAAGLADEV
jgi:ribosomal protein S18 acetylase RimI-like enzyme